VGEPVDRGTDARVQRSKTLVLEETYRLLTQEGIGGVSIDEVSRRSGVSKTTIYRHWPSRSSLLIDACSKLGEPAPTPDTGSFKGDLAALAGYLAHGLRSARWAAALPSIIDAAERDPEVAQMHAQLQAGFRAPFLAVAERAMDRGEIARNTPTEEVVAKILGPLFYRRWFSKEAIDDQFVSSIVDSVVAGAARPPGSTGD